MTIVKASKVFGAMAIAICASGSALAAPVYDAFGPLSATFGGSGIPNGAVASSTFGNGGVIGLTATQRYSNPPLTNNGAGTFYAAAGAAGADTGNSSPLTNLYSLWNFNFYIDNGNNTGLIYQLFMDVAPGSGVDYKSFGATPIAGVAQDSWNLGYNSYESGLGYTFDPTIDGVYSFLLTATNSAGERVATTSIDVTVGARNTVPEPASLALFGLALAGLAASRRRKI